MTEQIRVDASFALPVLMGPHAAPYHPLYPSLEQLLSPEVLSAVTGENVGSIEAAPYDTPDGRSGGSLTGVITNGGKGPRFVLKRISWVRDATMRLTGDRQGRAVLVWQNGLLEWLPPQIEHGVLACSRDGDGYAILLRDFAGSLLPAWEQRITERENRLVLEGMAALHATSFNCLWENLQSYGLCSLRTRYEFIFPRAVAWEAENGLAIVPYIRDGWDLFHEIVEPDISELFRALHADVGPLCRAMERYPHTIVHGDWHHGNLGTISTPQPRVILLDWSIVSWAPPAIDLAEYVLVGVRRLPASKEESIELYRSLLVRLLGRAFVDSWWEPQLELALLGEFLRLGFDKAQVAVHGETEAIRAREWEEISWWCRKARRAVRWL